ncbi:MAG: hypothetical protein ACHRXM_01965 [Isosphaerales bacterium]
MNSKVREAVLRIRMLTEEFSPEELAEAVGLLDGQEKDSFSSLWRKKSVKKRVSSRRLGKAESSKKKGETRALRELKLTDGEKYQVLREFETSIRDGKLLKTLDDFRSFGNILSKEFGTVKSVKDALPHLMALLVRMDLDSVRAAIAKVPMRHGEEENAFRRLANQIISGRANNASGA